MGELTRPLGPGEMRWTPERIARLKELWMSTSSGQIAEMFGISRSAVMGAVRRFGLPKKGRRYSDPKDTTAGAKVNAARDRGRQQPYNPGKPTPPKKKAAGEAPWKPVKEAPVLKIVSAEPRPQLQPGKVKIMDLTRDMCRWPSEGRDRPPYLYCGMPTCREGAPYCQEHHERAHRGFYVPRKKRAINE